MSQEANHRRQIPALTGLRFFAAFFILFAHTSDWVWGFQNHQISQYFSFLALYGMPLFFVLSGFVIHYNYKHLFATKKLGRAICEFSAARFARLYPLYFIFLIFSIFADNFIEKVYSNSKIGFAILAHYITLTQSWWYIVYNKIIIINYLFPLSWSISTEMFFYITYAAIVFLIFAIRGVRRSVIALGIYTLLIFSLFFIIYYYINNILIFAQNYVDNYIDLNNNFSESFYRWFFYFSPYVRLFEFLLGCLVAHLVMELGPHPVSRREWWLGLIAFAMALFFLAMIGLFYLAIPYFTMLNGYVHQLALNFLYAPAIGVVIFCVARYDTAFSRFLSTAWLVSLGELSYSIYLLHTWTLHLFLHSPHPFTGLWGFDALARTIVAILFTFLVASATYRLIEVPSRFWLKSKLNKLITLLFDRQPNESTFKFPVKWVTGSITALIFIAVAGQFPSFLIKQKIYQFVNARQPRIHVMLASYGLSCVSQPQQSPLIGNATTVIRNACNEQRECKFKIKVGDLGDPANGCAKDFSAQYSCVNTKRTITAHLDGEANGRIIKLRC